MPNLFTVTKHDQKKSHLQGRKLTIYCECLYLGYLDMI